MAQIALDIITAQNFAHEIDITTGLRAEKGSAYMRVVNHVM